MKAKKGLSTFVPVLMIVLFAFFAYLRGNITCPVFSYDPAQFVFTALGLEGSSPAFSLPGPLSKTLDLNLSRNMDPGGFTVLFRYWALVSTNSIWLRILPLVLLISALVVLYLLFFRLSRDPYFSCLLALFPLTNPVIAEWGITPRAYPMELFGIAWLAFLCYEFRSFVIAPLIFFATSRYSYVVALGCFTVMLFFIPPRPRARDLMLLWASCSLLIGYPLLRHFPQNREYIVPHLLFGKSLTECFRIVGSNLWRSETLYQIFFLTVFFLLDKNDCERKRHERFFWFLLLLDVAFIPLSAAGIYPWDLSQRYTLSVNFISYIAFGAGLCIFVKKNSSIHKRLSLPLFLAVGLPLCLGISAFRFDPYSDTLSAYQIIEHGASDRSFWSPTAFMEAKYLFEYGILKGDPAYPRQIMTGDRLLSLPKNVDYAVISKADQNILRYFEGRSDFKRSNKDFYHLVIFEKKLQGRN